MSKIKSLYLGYFNTAGELFIERCYASSQKQARFLLIRRIAKKKSMDPYRLFREFDNQKDNCSIKLEVEFEEESD